MTNSHVNGYDDENGDSGQGSSLDRDYSSYNGPNGHVSGGGVWQGSSTQNGQYYYNLPHRQNGQQQQLEPGDNAAVQAGNNNSPRRRAPGDTLDLSNREYRGSAFELYKKP